MSIETKPAAREQVAAEPETISPLLQEIIEADEIHRGLLDRLSESEKGEDVIKRRGRLLEITRRASIQSTNPEDWVLTKDLEGREIAMLTASGAKKVAPIWGISVSDVQPMGPNGMFEPVQKDVGEGGFSLSGSCLAVCGVTKTSLRINATRSSTEEFIGRVEKIRDDQGKETSRKVNVADLSLSVLTLLHTKAVRGHTGMHRVPIAELADNWGTASWKKVEHCTHGHGYGTSKDRNAQRVADPNIRETVAAFAKEVMAAAGGDKEAAAQILRECTAQKAEGKRKAFGGHDSFERLTADWQLERAVAAWKRHPMHPDSTEPGSNG